MFKIGAELPKLSPPKKSGYPFFGPPCTRKFYSRVTDDVDHKLDHA